MKAILPILVATALAASAQTSLVLYQADFSGSAATPLNGTAVDTSGATPAQHVQYGTVAGEAWTADVVLFADGHVTTGDPRGGATLAFTPQNGYVYTLTMTTSFAFSSADWVAVGFNEEDNYTDYQNEITGGVVWALTRPGYGLTFSQVAHFNPSGSLGNIGQGDYDTTAPSTLTIVLDTTLGTDNWSAKYYAGTAATGNLIATQADMGALATGIHSISLGWQNSNASTKFDSMELSVVEVPPAPSSTALIDFGNASGLSTTYGGLAYNAPANFTGSPLKTSLALNNTGGLPTGWSIEVKNTGGGTSNGGYSGAGATHAGTLPVAVSGFDPNAVRDNFYFNAGDQPAGQLTVTLSGLDNTKTYDLLFYGSRGSLDGFQTWQLITGTGTADPVEHNSVNNETVVVDWNAIAPVGGVIAFTINLTGTVGALNFGEVMVTGTATSPYGGWATGGELFTDDANGDGVKNGLAWILGAADPDVSALDKLPTLSTPTGFLQLNFTRKYPYAPAKLYVEYSNDLENWTKLLIPEALGLSTIGGDIEVTVGEGPPDTIQIKIPTSTHGSGGKLFARLSATEN